MIEKILDNKYWTRSHFLWCVERDPLTMFLIGGEWWICDVLEDASDQTVFLIDADANCKEWEYKEIECAEVFQTRFSIEDVNCKLCDEFIESRLEWEDEVRRAR